MRVRRLSREHRLYLEGCALRVAARIRSNGEDPKREAVQLEMLASDHRARRILEEMRDRARDEAREKVRAEPGSVPAARAERYDRAMVKVLAQCDEAFRKVIERALEKAQRLSPFEGNPTTKEERAAKTEQRFRRQLRSVLTPVSVADAEAGLPPRVKRRAWAYLALFLAELAGFVVLVSWSTVTPTVQAQVAGEMLAVPLLSCVIVVGVDGWDYVNKHRPRRLVYVPRSGRVL